MTALRAGPEGVIFRAGDALEIVAKHQAGWAPLLAGLVSLHRERDYFQSRRGALAFAGNR